MNVSVSVVPRVGAFSHVEIGIWMILLFSVVPGADDGAIYADPKWKAQPSIPGV